jgi:hypothetical protein
MALTYVYTVFPPTGAAVTAAGKVYNPNSAGIITGVAPADALSLQGVAGASLQLMAATGATADRPGPMPATALTGALNNLNPAPTPGLVFQDTTLSKAVYYVGTMRSSTGWVDYTGAAA